jgi:nitroreductase
LSEAGHIGQNVFLAATSMGMGAYAVGAFNDDAVNALVGVDGVDEAVVYVLAVGEIAWFTSTWNALSPPDVHSAQHALPSGQSARHNTGVNAGRGVFPR